MSEVASGGFKTEKGRLHGTFVHQSWGSTVSRLSVDWGQTPGLGSCCPSLSVCGCALICKKRVMTAPTRLARCPHMLVLHMLGACYLRSRVPCNWPSVTLRGRLTFEEEPVSGSGVGGPFSGSSPMRTGRVAALCVCRTTSSFHGRYVRAAFLPRTEPASSDPRRPGRKGA